MTLVLDSSPPRDLVKIPSPWWTPDKQGLRGGAEWWAGSVQPQPVSDNPSHCQQGAPFSFPFNLPSQLRLQHSQILEKEWAGGSQKGQANHPE